MGQDIINFAATIRSDSKKLDRKSGLKDDWNPISNEILLKVDLMALAYLSLIFCEKAPKVWGVGKGSFYGLQSLW